MGRDADGLTRRAGRLKWARGPRSATLAVLAALSATPADAEEACHLERPAIVSDKGLAFAADASAKAEWRERSAGGRLLTYGTLAWRGTVGGRRAYLTFDLIPGTSGPNHHMDFRPARRVARSAWRMTGTRYDLGRRYVVRTGPLAGEWTVSNCGSERKQAS